MRPKVIAIDGPAGSGKSTIGYALAARLGYAMLDTGMIYRLVARDVLSRDVDPTNAATVVPVAEATVADISISSGDSGRDVRYKENRLADLDLQASQINETVPIVARHPGVRELVKAIQRRLMDERYVILAGRDIGTVVAPDAELKLYLDVSIAERAARRAWSTKAGDASGRAGKVESELAERDRLDSERKISPLRVPDGALVVRTDKLSVDEAVEMIVVMTGLD